MKRSLRDVLADSHVAAATIAVLLFLAIDSIFRALWPYVADIVEFLATAVAIFDIPYASFTAVNRFQLMMSLWYVYGAVVELAAAYLLARWIYRSGPIRALIDTRRAIARSINAEV